MSDRKLMSVMFAAAVGVATVVAGSAPAAPFQVPLVAAPGASNGTLDAIQVQFNNNNNRFERKWRNGGPGPNAGPGPNRGPGPNFGPGPNRGPGPNFGPGPNRGPGPNFGQIHRGGNVIVHRGGNPYFNGHRGYPNYRPGYRRQGDFWFPPAAFALGAIIGGAMAAPSYDYYAPRYYERVVPEPSYRYRTAHERWCYEQYRSYRAWDNTFQPYHGPRKQCVSPYG